MGTSLWDVVRGFEKHEGNGATRFIDEGMEPIVVYMRDQIVGESKLASTSLKSLGLISGRGLLRLNQREKTPPENAAVMDVDATATIAAAAAAAAATMST